MIKISKRLLILCEDKKSSKFYLDSFKKDEKLKRDLSSVSIEIYQPTDFSPLGLVKEAKRRKKQAKRDRNAFDEIWIVLDKDGHANMPQAINMAEANKISIAISIVCFEYWIILHFEKTTRPFTRCDDVITYLKRFHFANYEKCTNCFGELKDRIPFAIESGKWLEKQVENDLQRGTHYFDLDAFTNMHKLVEKLFEPQKYLLLK